VRHADEQDGVYQSELDQIQQEFDAMEHQWKSKFTEFETISSERINAQKT
jgi:hypothetical protein